MLVTFLAKNMLSQTWISTQPHLLRVKQTKIHRFADVAVGFGPSFADLEHFDRGKFKPSTIENRSHAFKQLAAFFEGCVPPDLEGMPCRLHCALGSWNSGFGN